MANERPEFHISWTHVRDSVQSVVKFYAKNKPKSIISVGRGGMIPASMVGYYLKIKDIKLLPISRYHSESQQGESISETIQFVDKSYEYWPEYCHNDAQKDTLIIDDIFDEGNTLFQVKHLFPLASFVTLFCFSSHFKTIPKDLETYGITIEPIENKKPWVVFPWYEDWKDQP